MTAPAPSLEELLADMVFEHLDAVGDGGGGDVEFARGAHEALVAGSGVEEAQTFERRKRVHGEYRMGCLP